LLAMRTVTFDTEIKWTPDNTFRQALSDVGLLYAVGVTSAVVVWPPGVKQLPPEPYSGIGRPPVMPRRTPALQPMSVNALAQSLPSRAFQNISCVREPTRR